MLGEFGFEVGAAVVVVFGLVFDFALEAGDLFFEFADDGFGVVALEGAKAIDLAHGGGEFAIEDGNVAVEIDLDAAEFVADLGVVLLVLEDEAGVADHDGRNGGRRVRGGTHGGGGSGGRVGSGTGAHESFGGLALETHHFCLGVGQIVAGAVAVALQGGDGFFLPGNVVLQGGNGRGGFLQLLLGGFRRGAEAGNDEFQETEEEPVAARRARGGGTLALGGGFGEGGAASDGFALEIFAEAGEAECFARAKALLARRYSARTR